ncbi:MAG: putative sugar nucleotidyl transferase [Rhodothermales bacterium]
MHLCVFEDDRAAHFLPLVYTRAVYDLRLGIRSQVDVLRDAFGDTDVVLHCRGLVARVTSEEHGAPVNELPDGADVLLVNGRWVVEGDKVPDRLRAAAAEREGRLFMHRDALLAAWIPGAPPSLLNAEALTPEHLDEQVPGLPVEEIPEATLLERLWDLHAYVEPALLRDYAVRTGGLYVYERPDVTVCDGALLAAGERIYIGPGSVVRPGAVLNAEYGPIYIGRSVDIRERAVIKGPAYVGSSSVVMTGADIQGSSLGYATKIGGQVNGTVVDALSNKAHSGYLGDAYVGRWCNLGAGTNASNLRNDYAETRMYDAATGGFERTGHTFLGLVMGDHSNAGISTMFNTATVVGVSCNVFGAGFMPRRIPSFSWGEPGAFTEYRLEKALDVADVVMKRRNRYLTDARRENLRRVFEQTRGEVVHR